MHLLLQSSDLCVLFPECPHLLHIHSNSHALTIWPLNLGSHCLQLLQQLLSRGSSSWDVVETLVYELHKRVLLSYQHMEWLDVVPPTLHFRPGQEVVWILRVCIGVGKKIAREHLEEEIEFMKSKVVFSPHSWDSIVNFLIRQ